MEAVPNPRIIGLTTLATAAAAAFAVLTVLERDRRLTKKDRKALKKFTKQFGPRGRAIAAALHPLGKWYAYVPAAALASALVYAKGDGRRSERLAGAAAPLLAATVSALVNPLFDQVLPQPPPPPARASNPQPTFPSGHAFGLGAVALATAYILHRERIVGPAAATALAALPPLVGGAAKVIEQKHWPSEVAAGLLVALTIAPASALAYELSRAD